MNTTPCPTFTPNGPQFCVCGFASRLHRPRTLTPGIEADPVFAQFRKSCGALPRDDLEQMAAKTLYELFLRDTAFSIEDFSLLDADEQVKELMRDLEEGQG